MIALAFSSVSLSCTKSKEGQAKKPIPVIPVTAAKAIEKDVPLQLRAVGNVEPYSTVSIKSQVTGQLTRIHFKEGQDVQKGDLLFSIDARPYEAALKQADAALAKDTYQMENARREATRYEQLAQKDYVAKSQYDQVSTNAAALAASVEADKAARETARLQLGYCAITSPITGRTGSILIHEGNIIKANDDTKALVVITQIQPIFVNFTVPARHLLEIKNYMAKSKLTVEALLPGNESSPEQGILTFIDNAVDTSTGTIHLKATFDNNNKRLWPGTFVTVVVNLALQPRAVVVPSQAVMTGQKGQYVFVIKENSTVEIKPVTTGTATGAETVIASGLAAGEQVVTDGQMRLVAGSKVSIKQ